jgi:hypothetical protein
LRRAGTWNTVLNESWALRAEDTFDWPSGWPGAWQWPATSCSKELQNGRDIEAFRRELLSVKARNRLDDWERFLTCSALSDC